MPRKGNVPKREVLADPIYGSKVVTKLINNLMIDGKKGKAQTIVYDAFAMVAEKTGEDALEVFNKAMDNIMPVLEVKARRVGGANYQVPVEVEKEARELQAIRKKHQDDDTFSFWKCDYYKREVRVADHPNY